MKYLVSGALAALATVALTTSASAAIVCNADGDCWRVKERHKYPSNYGLTVYEDNWKWDRAHSNRYRWRDPGAGRGYYRSGVWITF